MRVLGAFYLRLTGTDTDVYQYLEPLYNDYRKLRRKLADGSKLLIYVFKCSSNFLNEGSIECIFSIDLTLNTPCLSYLLDCFRLQFDACG